MTRLIVPLRASSLVLGLAIFVGSTKCQAQTDVLTWHNDVARTGQNLSESILTPVNVNYKNFGLLTNVLVDGKVDAQPLYVSALTLPALGTHNVLYIATEHDSVYAVDADSGKLLWQKTLLPSGETTSDARNCNQILPEIGITATPVIDRTAGPNGAIYLVAMSKSSSRNYFQRLHALDLTTGAELFNGPINVQATYPGNGDGSINGTVSFNAQQYKDRPALLLLNGTIFTAFGSHCDGRPYGGWLMAWDEHTLAQTSAIDFVPNGGQAAPWNAGAGPAADAEGNIYISLGNGTFDTALNEEGFPNLADYGNALVKLSYTGKKLTVVDYWTMYNSTAESGADDDLGSGGVMLLPDQLDANGIARHLAIAAGKDSNLYVANRDNLGHYDATEDGTIYQQLTGALPGGVWSVPAYFNGRVYYGSVYSVMRSFEITAAKLAAAPGQTTATTFTYPGAMPSISANGNTNGIVWTGEDTSPAVLHAYDANNLNIELYNSDQAPNARDHFGNGNKFIVPTIANGKVYMATANSVGIFGFLPQTTPLLADGHYTTTNQSSKLLLDDPAASKKSGQVIWQYRTDGETEQLWFLSFNGQGYYTIQNVASKLFLTDPNTPATPGGSLEQETADNLDSQLWSLTKSGTGYVITNKLSGLVIDDLDSNPAYGAHIGLSTATGGPNQTWTIQ